MREQHSLHKILLYNLHLRRVSVLGAASEAEPGEEDFQRRPPPNSKFDCESMDGFFKDIDLESARQCLNKLSALQKNFTISYVLHREVAPYLLLKNNYPGQDCLVRTLEKVAVPREIFFQSNEEGSMNCYNARLSIREDSSLGIQALLHTDRVQVHLPLQKPLRTQEELRLLLTTWVVSPFWKMDDRVLISKMVSDGVCRKCLGEKNMYHTTDQIPPLWPQGGQTVETVEDSEWLREAEKNGMLPTAPEPEAMPQRDEQEP